MLMTALKSINLRGNSMGTEGWCAIFDALRNNKDNKIESWDLSSQKINPFPYPRPRRRSRPRRRGTRAAATAAPEVPW